MALRDVILKDLRLKSFALALASLIWFTVQFAIHHQISQAQNPVTQMEEQTFSDLPVLVVSAAADVRDFKVKPSRVEVVVRGDADVLQKLSARDIRVTVDLTDIESARNLRKRVDVSTPARVTFVRVEPEDLEIVVPPKR